jgi:chromosome partitioning protein
VIILNRHSSFGGQELIVTSICNNKGGVGKSTTAVNLAAYLALNGEKTLVIDLDPQGAATVGLGTHPWDLKSHMYDVFIKNTSIKDILLNTEIPNLKLAPSNLDLSGVEPELANQMAKEFILRDKIGELEGYDHVIIDNPPTLGLLTVNSLMASTDLLIPVQCEFYALGGMAQLMKVIEMASQVRVRMNMGSKQNRHILLTMYDARTNLCKLVVDKVREMFGSEVFITIIPRSIKLAEAPLNGKPICLYAPESPGAEAYKRLAREVLYGIKG